jgi:septal ring-binding cell division protein DamX
VAPRGSTYQWHLNGTNIVGATAATLLLDGIGTLQAGDCTVQVTGPSGAPPVTVDAGTVTVMVDARLVNGSVRGFVGANQELVAGFAVSGALPKQLLIRGIGPALAQFGVGGALASPRLTMFDAAAAPIATNLAWGHPPVTGTSSVPATAGPAGSAVFNQVQAFPLASGAADSAMLVSVPSGTYTAQVSGAANASGIALGEVYDADIRPSTSRVINRPATW